MSWLSARIPEILPGGRRVRAKGFWTPTMSKAGYLIPLLPSAGLVALFEGVGLGFAPHGALRSLCGAPLPSVFQTHSSGPGAPLLVAWWCARPPGGRLSEAWLLSRAEKAKEPSQEADCACGRSLSQSRFTSWIPVPLGDLTVVPLALPRHVGSPGTRFSLLEKELAASNFFCLFFPSSMISALKS